MRTKADGYGSGPGYVTRRVTAAQPPHSAQPPTTPSQIHADFPAIHVGAVDSRRCTPPTHPQARDAKVQTAAFFASVFRILVKIGFRFNILFFFFVCKRSSYFLIENIFYSFFSVQRFCVGFVPRFSFGLVLAPGGFRGS